MSELFNQGLLIAAIGMGLVFLALIFLWGLITLIARLPISAGKGKDDDGPQPQAAPEPVEDKPAVEDNRDLRARAAAAAVAVALLVRQSATRLAPPPEDRTITPWQTARRSGQFSMNAHITTRKNRGSAR